VLSRFFFFFQVIFGGLLFRAAFIAIVFHQYRIRNAGGKQPIAGVPSMTRKQRQLSDRTSWRFRGTMLDAPSTRTQAARTRRTPHSTAHTQVVSCGTAQSLPCCATRF
jgi:hypothetical protein